MSCCYRLSNHHVTYLSIWFTINLGLKLGHGQNFSYRLALSGNKAIIPPGGVLWWVPSLGAPVSGRLPLLLLLLCLSLLPGEGHVGLVVPGWPLRTLSQVNWQWIPGEGNVFEGMEEKNPQDDGEEPTDCPHHPICAHTQPLLEQDSRAGHYWGGEEHIVDWCDYRGVEYVQGFVEVTDLDANAYHQAY